MWEQKRPHRKRERGSQGRVSRRRERPQQTGRDGTAGVSSRVTSVAGADGFSVKPTTKLEASNRFRFHTAAQRWAAGMEAETSSEIPKKDRAMTANEAINERIEALNEELSAIHQAQNISRCWAGNDTALLNLDRRRDGSLPGHQLLVPAPLRLTPHPPLTGSDHALPCRCRDWGRDGLCGSQAKRLPSWPGPSASGWRPARSVAQRQRTCFGSRGPRVRSPPLRP